MKIDIEPNIKYGILLSGGIDSAILFSLVIQSFLEKSIPIKIQPFTIPKKDGSYLYVPQIINFLKNQYRVDLPETIHVGNTKYRHNLQSWSAVKEILATYPDIKKIFVALNKNPNIDLPGLPPKRITDPGKGHLIFPFLNLVKTDILQFSEQYQLQELYNITHSCTNQPIGRCNHCWQCGERAWAFKSLNLIDTGVN